MSEQTNVNPRRSLLETMRTLDRTGLITGSAGNASCRGAAYDLLITPSGVPVERLTEDSMVAMSLDGIPLQAAYEPSSEWRMHRDIYRARPDIGAVVHTHSTYATALACIGSEIPAFHYMVAVAGGNSIRCARYATFGTQALSDAALEALRDRQACLLANHGVIALGRSAARAAVLAIEVEQLARQFCVALQSGKPVLLSDDEMCVVVEKFKTYGQH
jgi:L-fuculose-phosphate aldolase